MAVRVREKCCSFLSLCFLIAAFASAAPAAAQDVPKIGFSVGYEALRTSDSPCNGCDFSWYQYGLNLDGAVPITPALHAVGEFGYARHPFHEDPIRHVGGLNALTFGGGLRWEPALAGMFRPYVQLIAGLQRDNTDGVGYPSLLESVDDGLPRTSAMVHPGVGLHVPITALWGVIGQVDYRRVFTDEPTNAVRVVLGVRLNRR
jgi:hypothetical protein